MSAVAYFLPFAAEFSRTDCEHSFRGSWLDNDTLWIDIIVSAPALVLLMGYIRSNRGRWASYVVLLLSPVLAMTLVMAFTPPAPPRFLAWWSTALAIISPVSIIWAILATVGFATARWNVR